MLPYSVSTSLFMSVMNDYSAFLHGTCLKRQCAFRDMSSMYSAQIVMIFLASKPNLYLLDFELKVFNHSNHKHLQLSYYTFFL